MHDDLVLSAVQSPLAGRGVVVVCRGGERVEVEASPLWLLSSLVRRAGQGEVEQIAMMKPKALTEHEDGMLEFLEDIVIANDVSLGQICIPK